MNYIRHLSGFFEKVAKDKAINPTHVSLYISLFQFWNRSRFVNPISITREEIMRISKISSFTTYHRCLKALHDYGYIKYEPSFNPYKGSHVYLFNFSDEIKPLESEKQTSSFFGQANSRVLAKQCTSTDTGTVQVDGQVLESYINNTNDSNIINDSKSLNLGEPAKKIENEIPDFLKNDIQKEEKSSGKKEEKLFAFADSMQNENERQKEMPEDLVQLDPISSNPAFADYNAKRTANSQQKSSAKKEKGITELVTDSSTEQESVEHVRHLFSSQIEKPPETYLEKPLPNPTIEEVINYFREQNYPAIEANKFFNYFKSIGWLVGGKTPMTDWPAAARNWMLNAPKFVSNERTDRTKSLDTSAGKDYSEPL